MRDPSSAKPACSNTNAKMDVCLPLVGWIARDFTTYSGRKQTKLIAPQKSRVVCDLNSSPGNFLLDHYLRFAQSWIDYAIIDSWIIRHLKKRLRAARKATEACEIDWNNIRKSQKWIRRHNRPTAVMC